MLLAAACSGGGDSDSSTPTEASPVATAASARFSADDPAGDCLTNANAATACTPGALDMRRFTVERDAAGNVVLTIEVSPAGYPALGDYSLLVGIDTDRNATTGNTGYASFHGMAPNVELNYRVTGGQAQSTVRLYGAAPGPPTNGDASQVEWRQLDATRLQATIKPAAINNVQSFDIVTDLNITGFYDHIPDNARVAFPEGRVVPK